MCLVEIMLITKRADGTVRGKTLEEKELNALIEKNQPAKSS